MLLCYGKYVERMLLVKVCVVGSQHVILKKTVISNYC